VEGPFDQLAEALSHMSRVASLGQTTNSRMPEARTTASAADVADSQLLS
jgi:hypothetical protein